MESLTGGKEVLARQTAGRNTDATLPPNAIVPIGNWENVFFN